MPKANCEAWDYMTTTQDMRRINKTKGLVIGHRWKLQTVEACIGPTLLNGNVVDKLEPSYPEKLHLPRPIINHAGAGIDDVYVEYANNTSVDVLMRRRAWSLAGQEHDVAMVGFGVDGVLSSTYIISGVVNPHYVMTVHPVGLEVNPIKLEGVVDLGSVRTSLRVSIVHHLRIQHGFDTRQEMSFEFSPEVLRADELPAWEIAWLVWLTLTAGSPACERRNEPMCSG
jgi:hypothetical protein